MPNLSVSSGEGDVDKELLSSQPFNNGHHAGLVQMTMFMSVVLIMMLMMLMILMAMTMLMLMMRRRNNGDNSWLVRMTMILLNMMTTVIMIMISKMIMMTTPVKDCGHVARVVIPLQAVLSRVPHPRASAKKIYLYRYTYS